MPSNTSRLEIEIGSRLADWLSLNVTQSMLARDAGIGLRTLRRVEAGESSTFDTFLRVALALDLGDAVLGAIPTGRIRPIERVSRTRFRTSARTPASTGRPRARSWTWGDGPHD